MCPIRRSVDQAYHDVPLFLHCLTEQVAALTAYAERLRERLVAMLSKRRLLDLKLDEIALSGLEDSGKSRSIEVWMLRTVLLCTCKSQACGSSSGDRAAVHEVLRKALKHRFYPFAPGVAPEELEQLLLIHAFEDLLAKAQPERSWHAMLVIGWDAWWVLEYLGKDGSGLLLDVFFGMPGKGISLPTHRSSVLVTHPTYNDWAQVHGSGLVSSSTWRPWFAFEACKAVGRPTKLQVVENMDARDVGYNAIAWNPEVEKLACPPDGSLILVSRMESMARIFKDNLVLVWHGGRRDLEAAPAGKSSCSRIGSGAVKGPDACGAQGLHRNSHSYS
ncbi:hypothetical protein AK812_SmicGene7664 [Symbiodinium microadriaticum]|uniref:Uncharacterized protein n=1 Tax=Symbiodinium microadriaticum TaxID=2951 RepID=A0A1Q9EN03_SYMMI|nr:hypothetical protein AK812_SmicGene7664 [Symbiodinium microadriaticum]